MSSFSSSSSRQLASTISIFVFLVSLSVVSAQGGGDWDIANATSTFNGQDLAGCGFENLTEYQGKTVAVSASMYGTGEMCGACFEIRCNGSSNCLPNSVQVTASASCAASYFNGTRNWCLQPRKHFELPTSVFSIISKDHWAVVPVQFRRVKCARQGGIRFRLAGSGGTVGALVYNVAGTGDVVDLKIKGSETGWVDMINGDDQRWVTEDRISLVGQSLSFRVTSSDGTVLESMNVATKDWKFGDTCEGGQF